MRAAILLLLLIVVSGCAGQGPTKAQGVAGPDPTDAIVAPPLVINETLLDDNAAFDVLFGAERCHGGQVWFNIDRGSLQSAIPDGYIAAEATALVGPHGVGRGIAAVEVYKCAVSSFGEGTFEFAVLTIQIEPPEAAKVLGPVDTEWYQLALFTGRPEMHAAYERADAKLFKGEATHAVLSIPNGPATGDGQAKDQDGSVFTFQALTAAARRQVDFTKRTWSDGPHGTLIVDQRVNSDLMQGTARCELRSGSVVHEIVKSTSCAPNETHFGWVWNDTQWDGRIVYAPQSKPRSA